MSTKTPAPPKGDDYLTDGRKPGSTPAPKVHREPGQSQVKTK